LINPNTNHNIVSATISDDKEIKVEKALLDLNELKSQMFSEKNSNINATSKD